MKKMDLNRLMDILDDVKKIDSMILLHQNLNESSFMTSQYQAKKTKLISQFIDMLVTSPGQSEQQFLLIHQVIGKYYPSVSKNEVVHDADIDQLLAAV